MRGSYFVLVSAMVVLHGCGATDQQDDAQGTTAEDLARCDIGDGVQVTMASLAVAVGTELREIDPLRQFEIGSGVDGERIVLVPGVCPDGCPRTEGLLDLQDAAPEDFPRETFNAARYRTELVENYAEQVALETRDGVELPGEHQLRYAAELDLGGCGLHTVFDVLEPDCEDDCASYGGDAAAIANRLLAFGGEENPFIDFRVDGSQIMIDPDNADTGSGGADDPRLTCDDTPVCRVWDRQWIREGCCECPGVVDGEWIRYPRNQNYALCVP